MVIKVSKVRKKIRGLMSNATDVVSFAIANSPSSSATSPDFAHLVLLSCQIMIIEQDKERSMCIMGALAFVKGLIIRGVTGDVT